MKSVIIATTLALSLSSFASSPDLVCRTQSGEILTWNKKYGELTIRDSNGKIIESQDALKEGALEFIETNPATIVTPLVYADENDSVVVAEIAQRGTKVTVMFEKHYFVCQ